MNALKNWTDLNLSSNTNSSLNKWHAGKAEQGMHGLYSWPSLSSYSTTSGYEAGHKDTLTS
jgi:hypothetical protein